MISATDFKMFMAMNSVRRFIYRTFTDKSGVESNACFFNGFCLTEENKSTFLNKFCQVSSIDSIGEDADSHLIVNGISFPYDGFNDDHTQCIVDYITSLE